MNRRSLAISILVLALAFAISLGVGFSATPAAAKLAGKEVKIGVINQVSGRFAAYGQDSDVAFKMAIEKLRKAGGIGGLPAKFLFCDDASKTEEAITCMRKLANSDNVLMVIGPFTSAACKVAFPVANRIGIVSVSHASAAPGLGKANRPWAFRAAMTSDKLNGPAFARWLKKNPSIKSIAYLWDNSDVVYKGEHNGVFPHLFKKHGIKVADDITFGPNDIDFAAQVTRAKTKNPGGIIISANYSQGARVVHEIRRQKMNQPIYVGIGMSSPEFIVQGGQAVEGVVNAQAFWPGDPNPRVQEFVKAYASRHNGKLPPMYAASAYDLIFMVKKIIEEEGVTNKPGELKKDRLRIRGGFEKLKNYPSLQGVIAFNQDGEMVQSKPVVLEVRGKKWDLYK